MASAQPDSPETFNRKMLAAAIGSICIGEGFDTIEKDALGTLVEMLQCYLSQIGLSSKNYCELAGRTEPVVADIILAFVELGITVPTLEDYMKTSKYPSLPPIVPQQPPKQPNMLTAGVRQSLPPHIPSHLPEFPVPHAYIRTPTHRQPTIDYESVREKAAIQKKDVERALTKFLAKTAPSTHNLFDTDDTNAFPLIASQPTSTPYLSALLPQDQIFDQEDLEYDSKEVVGQKKEHVRKEDVKMEKIEEEVSESSRSEDPNSSNNFIDNPYLAATKLPSDEDMDMS
ncbi:transcription initiation factor TFIID subunit 8-like [Harmonia axyridis]|uniref:transcription initiation factor TFIID subunit 8-like n=1 Tax=Harmonia axyridis TaxID=115357 RepID=UPI001E277C63|nr:transcription initiation factor TFIID subunit 8-like [Harmonia axyridis]XP_045478429.1 transcription initiation factor TFIID subunit 8-like [Harmonia axyridis]